MKPLHVTTLFPIKPCKQVRCAGVLGSWGAERVHGAPGWRGCANDGIAQFSPWGQPGHQHRPGCPGTVRACRMHPAVLRSPMPSVAVGCSGGAGDFRQPAIFRKRSQGTFTTPAPDPMEYRSLQPLPDAGFHQRDHNPPPSSTQLHPRSSLTAPA